MRWQSGQPKYRGQKRKLSRFLIFPKRIGDEWRWLERATFMQRVEETVLSRSLYWEDYAWVDEKEEVKLK